MKRLENRGVIREQSIEGYPDAGSVIDGHVSFHNASDLVRYTPRAFQITLLSPFPGRWFGEGSLEAYTLMRRVSGFEMVVVYAGLMDLVFTLGFWWRQIELWLAGRRINDSMGHYAAEQTVKLLVRAEKFPKRPGF